MSTLSRTRSALLAPMVRFALTTFLALTALIVLTSLASSSAPAQAQSSPCQLQVDKTASPSQLNLGEFASLELRVDSTCPRQSTPLRVVLAVDSSSSMEPDGKIQAARSAGLRFAEVLDLLRDGLGVASFSDRAYEMVAVTGDRAQRAAGPASEAIVFLSDGRPSISDASVLAAAQAAKDAGIIIASACVVTDRLPANMRYVPGSAQPAPASQSGDALTWVFREPLPGRKARLGRGLALVPHPSAPTWPAPPRPCYPARP